jgi:hypothetical protein
VGRIGSKDARDRAVLSVMPFSATKTASRAVTALLFSFACRQTIHSQVTTFNQLSELERNATFAIMPLAQQRDSREFKAYERRVRAHLEANGFVPTRLDRAEFVVAMAYADDNGTDILSSYPIIGQSGSSSSRMAGTLQAYHGTRAYSATAERPSRRAAEAEKVDESPDDDAPRVLRLDIVRRDSIGFGDIEKVFEGEVVSTGSEDALAEIVPAMIEALFADFPGQDGEVRQVASKSVPSIEEIAARAPAGGSPSGSARTGGSQ